MKKPDPTSLSGQEAIEATAAAWLAQRDDGLSAAQLAEFARWHEADPRHAAALARLEKTWALLGQLREYRPEARVHPDRDLLATPRPVLVFYKPAVAAAAALAACFAIALGWLWLRPAAPATAAGVPQYATTTGGYQRMTLEDGSVVELNADSEVRVNYTPAERRVRLLKGEAHFIVAKNRERPFWVEAGAVTVRAVGTAFNVRLGTAKIEVLVTEGKVEVDQSAVRTASAKSPGRSLLEAGQLLVIQPENPVSRPLPEQVAPDAMRDALAWQDARLKFADTQLGDAVAQFNRHNRVQIELGDAELTSIQIGGAWRAQNVELFVRMLTNDPANGVVVEPQPDPNRIVLRRAR